MRARRGMTLIELTVALTITGAAIGLGYSAFGTLVDRRTEASARATDVTRASSIRRALSGWLSSARLTIEEDEIVFRSVDGVWRTAAGEIADDHLTFFTSAPTPVAEGGTIVRLHVERGDSLPASARGLVAELHGARNGRRLSMMIDTAVSAFDVAILTSVLGRREWQTSWVSSTILPAGIRLTLGSREGTALAPLLGLPLTISVENGR